MISRPLATAMFNPYYLCVLLLYILHFNGPLGGSTVCKSYRLLVMLTAAISMRMRDLRIPPSSPPRARLLSADGRRLARSLFSVATALEQSNNHCCHGRHFCQRAIRLSDAAVVCPR